MFDWTNWTIQDVEFYQIHLLYRAFHNVLRDYKHL